MDCSVDLGNSLEKRPGIFIIGSPNVGKRTVLSRLLSLDHEGVPDLSSEAIVHGWTIDTKYYTADVSVWTAHLHDQFSFRSFPAFTQLAALVMVFDISEPASLAVLQQWVFRTKVLKFDILLCIGNKVDLVRGHPAHVEYRRRLQRLSDSADLFGLSETEGLSLLGDEDLQWEIKRSCLEWCSENHFEYVEACASNSDFDKCLSVDGDSQGVQRIYDALSAHMWPGMVLKSGNKSAELSFIEKSEFSEEESDYEIEYEVLSAGSAELWDEADEVWVSAEDAAPTEPAGSPPAVHSPASDCCDGRENAFSDEAKHMDRDGGVEGGTCFGFEDLDRLMSEIGSMRNGMGLMPDLQRREMAGKLAMKMAAMFGGEDDEGV